MGVSIEVQGPAGTFTIRQLAERWNVTRQRVHQILRDAGVQLQPTGYGRLSVVNASDIRKLDRARRA